MKKLILITALLILILTACSKSNETTNNEGSTTGKVISTSVEFISSPENEFIQPGQTATFSVIEKYEENTSKNILNGYSVEINNNNVAKVNQDHSVTVLESSLSGTEFEVTVKFNDDSYVKKYTVRKSLADTYDKEGVITDPEAYDAIVNKKRSLPSNYKPSDLVKLQVPTQLKNPEINQLRKVAADALKELFDEAKKEGFNLIARSGYRSYATQNALYNGNVAKKGQAHADKYSAKPGTSEHQTGLSIDITCAMVDYQLSSDFGETPEGIWVKENAHNSGFIIRYPKGKQAIVGYEYEPWHLRYLGVELATKVYNSGLTLEEYFEQP